MADPQQDLPSIHNTKDGSHTLYSSSFGQFYHNPNGAIDESKHVFFDTPNLLSHLRSSESLTILEVGFGTGLNFLLLADILKANSISLPVSFFSIEAFPLSSEVAQSLNYGTRIGKTVSGIALSEIFDQLKPGLNSFDNVFNSGIDLHLFYGDFFDFPDQHIEADFIFHDPFSPKVNGELWTVNTFENLRKWSSARTTLATYCAASKARATMAKAGWMVYRAKGALGKREMTIASLSEKKLKGIKPVNSQRLIHRFDAGEFDL